MIIGETGNNAYEKFRREKQRVLWYFYIVLLYQYMKKSTATSGCGNLIETVSVHQWQQQGVGLITTF